MISFSRRNGQLSPIIEIKKKKKLTYSAVEKSSSSDSLSAPRRGDSSDRSPNHGHAGNPRDGSVEAELRDARPEANLRDVRSEANHRDVRIGASHLPEGLANALAPEQSLLLDEYFLHRRRQVRFCAKSNI